MPEFKYKKAVIKRGKRKENIEICSMTKSTVQDGYDFNVMSDHHVATGQPDGRQIEGWNKTINCDALVNTKGRLKNGQFIVPSFCGDMLVVDKEHYIITETGWRGGWGFDRSKAVVSIRAIRYEEDYHRIYYEHSKSR